MGVPSAGSFVHDRGQSLFDVSGDFLEPRGAIELQEVSRSDRGEPGLALLGLEDRDAIGKGGRDLGICFEGLLGLLRISHFEDEAVAGIVDALFAHLLLQINHIQDAELVRLACLGELVAWYFTRIRDGEKKLYEHGQKELVFFKTWIERLAGERAAACCSEGTGRP